MRARQVICRRSISISYFWHFSLSFCNCWSRVVGVDDAFFPFVSALRRGDMLLVCSDFMMFSVSTWDWCCEERMDTRSEKPTCLADLSLAGPFMTVWLALWMVEIARFDRSLAV